MNYKFSDLLASLGLSQLEKRNYKIKKILNNFKYLKNNFFAKQNNIKILEPASKNNIPLWNIIITKDRLKLEKLLIQMMMDHFI